MVRGVDGDPTGLTPRIDAYNTYCAARPKQLLNTFGGHANSNAGEAVPMINT